jgi:hypothetical protein
MNRKYFKIALDLENESNQIPARRPQWKLSSHWSAQHRVIAQIQDAQFFHPAPRGTESFGFLPPGAKS